jgi:precorrin-6B methylase 2
LAWDTLLMNGGDVGVQDVCVEDGILLVCARTRLSPEQAEWLGSQSARDLDWVYLIDKALRQAVLPLLYWHLRATVRETAPPEWMQYLRECFEANARRNLALTKELLNIVDSLRASGIPAVPYKGPVLASLAYGNLALREFDDLDLILPSKDIAGAYEQMAALGYRPVVDLRLSAEPRLRGVPGQYQFLGARGCVVELHTERTLRYFPVPLNLEDLTARLQPVALGGRAVSTFSTEDLLPLLCVHASKHLWDHLRWICDVAELVQNPRGLDWQQTFAQARRLDAERMLHLGLLLAKEVLEARLPEEVLQRAGSDRVAQRLSAQLAGRLLAKTQLNASMAERLLYRLQTQRTFSGGLRHVARVTFTPTEEDWKKFRLPAWLAPLYPLLRLWRLGRSYGLGIRWRPAPNLSPYVPSPSAVVERLLAFADLQPNDVLFDLGCGDGRIVVAAAKRFGIRAVGVEVDRGRVALARAAARREGVDDLVKILRHDAKTVGLSEATVVTLYLTPPGNLQLREKLLEELRPGTRVVTRDFVMPAWVEEKVETYEDPAAGTETVFHMFRVPLPGGRPAVLSGSEIQDMPRQQSSPETSAGQPH